MEDQIQNQEIQQAQEQTPQAPAPSSNKDEQIRNNFIALRQKLEEEERRRKEAERRAEELERMRTEQRPQQPQEEDDYSGVDDDDYVPAKVAKKTTKALKSKTAQHEEEIRLLKSKLENFETMQALSTFKDSNEIVTDENLKTLARLYPNDYNSMMANPTLSGRTLTAYNMIKNYGIYDSNLAAADKRIANNLSKPGSSNATVAQQPQTPLTRLGDYERRSLSEADRDRIMRRVEEIKSRG